MTTQKTFRNLQVLEDARNTAKELLLDRYDEVVKPFTHIIDTVAKANNENHFEAMKRIQDQTDLSDDPDKKVIFAAALMELSVKLMDDKMAEGYHLYLKSLKK